MKYSEGEMAAVKVGRYISVQTGKLIKISKVKEILGITVENSAATTKPVKPDMNNVQSFDFNGTKIPPAIKTSLKSKNTARRVSFQTDLEKGSQYLSWFNPYQYV
jgi:hypothetical protein